MSVTVEKESIILAFLDCLKNMRKLHIGDFRQIISGVLKFEMKHS